MVMVAWQPGEFASQVAYIEDQPVFVEVTKSLGVRGIVHTGYESTRGLTLADQIDDLGEEVSR